MRFSGKDVTLLSIKHQNLSDGKFASLAWRGSLNGKYRYYFVFIDALHKWRLNLNNNTYTSLASHSCENFFSLKHGCEAKDVGQ